MNKIAEEIRSYFGVAKDPSLLHYGKPHTASNPGSGRYPWGSGDRGYQHAGDFYAKVRAMEKEGFSFTDADGKTYFGTTAIAKAMGMSTTDFRAAYSVARAEYRSERVARAKKLRDKGWSLDAIAEEMGLPGASSVNALLNANAQARADKSRETADFLKKMINERGAIDVGVGVEKELGVSKTKLQEALYILQAEGYPVYSIGVQQVTNKQRQTINLVACPPGSEYKDAYGLRNEGDIHTVTDYKSSNDGESFHPSFVYPESMDSKRLAIRFAEDGGTAREGVLEIRRGVEDLDLNGSNYAQVRILVDGTHYIKGMAVYSDDVPEGYDCIFNSNKSQKKGKLGALKEIKRDADGNPEENPFGSSIKPIAEGGQYWYTGKDGKEHLSLINKKNDEGDWGNWSDKLPSQFLAKQPMKLIKKQLKLTEQEMADQYDEICSVTNPTLKKYLLNEFASKCDADASDLAAVALPRQKYQVLLPLKNIKDTEVYAPNFEDGETVALVRYPHQGTYEIPILKVNNKNKEGQAYLSKNPIDAIGINKKVADRLSGADFDGDTVAVIPCNSDRTSLKIQSTPLPKGLEGFDAKVEYAEKPGMKYMSKGYTQNQMGVVSNLVMDMTLKGASEEELVKATKHAQVVIDAEKHKLDYSQSEKDNDIQFLKNKYQKHIGFDGEEHLGASTLITRAGAEIDVPKTRGQGIVNKETGEITYKLANETYVDTAGKTQIRTQKATQMSTIKDAYELSSGTPQENAYAEYANFCKSMANSARKEAINTKGTAYSAAANKEYKNEVESIKAKIDLAESNAPRERAAQRAAYVIVQEKKAANPSMTKEDERKLRDRTIKKCRENVGAQRHPITYTDREWGAIQAGAVSSNTFERSLKYSDTDALKQRAMPRDSKKLSATKQNRIKTLAASGYTNAEIAKAVGVSTNTVSEYIK